MEATAAAAAGPPEVVREQAQEQINAYWNQRSPVYDAEPGHGIQNAAEHRAWLRALSDLLPPAPSDVLDVGTGTGFLALLLAELGHRVRGVDLSEGMLSLAREKAARLAAADAGTRAPLFAVGDAVAPPGDPASLDAVVSRHVLWTLTDLEAAFRKWHRLLRPGGRVVAIDGLWKLSRRERQNQAAARAEPWRALWAKHYSAAVQSTLPLFDAETHDPAIAAATAAGFDQVRVSALEDVERAERAINPDGGTSQPRYVLTARKPA